MRSRYPLCDLLLPSRSARALASATTALSRAIFCSCVSPGTGPDAPGIGGDAALDGEPAFGAAGVFSVEASGARSATVSAPAAGEAVAAAGLSGAAEASPVDAWASAAGRCASACADESVPEVEAAAGVAPDVVLKSSPAAAASLRRLASATIAFRRASFCSGVSPGTGPGAGGGTYPAGIFEPASAAGLAAVGALAVDGAEAAGLAVAGDGFAVVAGFAAGAGA